MKKILVLFILIAMFSNTATFAINRPSEWAEKDIEALKESGKFREEAFERYNKDISRGEFIYLAVRLFELVRDGDEYLAKSDVFFEDTYDYYALKGSRIGITDGVGKNLFGPEKLVTREQLATMLVKTLQKAGVKLKEADEYKFADEDDFSSWAKNPIYIARANGIITDFENNKFDPKSNATVEDTLSYIKNILSSEEMGMKENLNCASFFDDVKVPKIFVFKESDYPAMNVKVNYSLPSKQIFWRRHLREGLLAGVETFDFSDQKMYIQNIRLIYRSLYYNQDFMGALDRDFKIKYLKRDERFAYKIQIIYGEKGDKEFKKEHLKKIREFEKECGKVTHENAHTIKGFVNPDRYSENEYEKIIKLHEVHPEEKSREEIVEEFTEKLREAFLEERSYISTGQYPLTSSEATEAFLNLYYDRDFNKEINKFYELRTNEKSSDGIRDFLLTYQESDTFLKQQLYIIKQHEKNNK